MSFITASYDYSGSYMGGIIESFSNSPAYTILSAPFTYQYNGNEMINTSKIIIQVPITGPSNHTDRPAKL